MADIYGMMMDGLASGERGAQRGKQSKLASLAGQAYTAPREQRQALLGQMAQVDPGAAYDAEKHFGGMDENGRKQLGQYAAAFLALPPDQKPQAYGELSRRAQALGIPAPMDYRPEYDEGLAKLAQAFGGGSVQGNVQSTYIDAQGNRVAIMRDGSTQVLGQNAPSNQIIDTGNGFYGVNKGNLQAAPVMVGGQAPQRAPSEVPFSIDPSLPPQVQAAIRADEGQWAQAPDGASVPIGSQDGQLRSAPKPADPLEIERLRLAQDASQRDQQRLELAQQAATRPRSQMSAAEQKDLLARKAKIPQLQNAIRGMSRIDAALNALEGGMLGDTGPIDAQFQRFTPKGQELEAAVGAIQNSILSLTRVPGIGSQSDLEARIAMLQYPSLDKPPEVNRRTLENLKLFMQDLAQAYEVATKQDAGQQGAQPSSDIDAILDKYR